VPWSKVELSDEWYSKLKHYRDEMGFRSLPQAQTALLQRALLEYEDENGELPEEYDKEDKPTWDR